MVTPMATAPDPAERLLFGTRYRFLRPLGQSEAATVHLAQHVQLRREVVVKVFERTLTGDLEAAERTRIEALSRTGVVAA